MTCLIWDNKILNQLQLEFGFEVFTPGLDRTFDLYKDFIFELKNIQIITVAGTNGKGQVSFSLAKSIALNNKRVAAWTSPHVLKVSERFKFYENENEETLNEKIFEAFLNDLINIKKSKNVNISFYEALFYIFLRWASSLNLDYLILEVGLGGRLDAVNHLYSNINIVTSISRDHIEILGNRFDKILNEKLGIVKENSTLITSFYLNYLIENTYKYIENKNVKYLNISPKLDDYFSSNQQIVKKVLNELGLNFYQSKLDEMSMKGRFEKISDQKGEVVFNGAHNIDGIRRFLQREVKKDNQKEDLSSYLVSFSKRTKDELKVILKMIAYYLPKKSVTICFFEHPKAEKRDIIISILDELSLREHFQIESDWKERIISSNRRPKIIVFGSFYFIGEIQRHIFTQSNQSIEF